MNKELPVGLAALLLILFGLTGMRCEPNPVDPSTGGTGGYWPTPPVTGGSVGTGGASTGGVVETGGFVPNDPVAEFCAHLGALGCPEGADFDACVSETEAILAMGPRASLDLSCVINATTQEAVRACKSVVCGGVL